MIDVSMSIWHIFPKQLKYVNGPFQHTCRYTLVLTNNLVKKPCHAMFRFGDIAIAGL